MCRQFSDADVDKKLGWRHEEVHMIYNVEAALGPQQTDEDWQRWYGDMKPPESLLTVLGLNSAQRFKGISHKPYAYVAIYSIDSVDVMTSAAYRGVGGGNFLTNRWKPMLSMWTRDLYDGLETAPPVSEDSLLGFFDRSEPSALPAGIEATWLSCAGLDKTTPYRALAVLKENESDRYLNAGFRLFKPLSPYHTA